MNTEELLQELSAETYIRLQPSTVHGIGVFAVQDIPKGCRKMFSNGVGDWIRVPISEVAALPPHSRDLVETYCLWDETDYFVPDYGFKVMDLVNYLNHSGTPNLVSVEDGNIFEAIRLIKTGEELFIDYGKIVDITY